MTEHSQLPWQWHPRSEDQAHEGAVFRLERPGHAYAIAMQPRYVEAEQWAEDAALIVRAVNSHYELVKALDAARDAIEYSIEVHGTDHGGMMLRALNDADRALSLAKGEGHGS